MIWDTPTHANRSIAEWLDDPDTGFSSKLISLIDKQTGAFKDPKHVIRNRKLIPIGGYNEISTVCKFLKCVSAYVDSALWVSCRGLADRLRTRPDCVWLDMPYKRALVTCDVLVVSEIPPKLSTDMATRNDRREIEIALNDRLRIESRITILIGDNQSDIAAVERVNAIDKALEDLS